MKMTSRLIASVLALTMASAPAGAAPALTVLGRDYVFPQSVAGLPTKLSDVKGLEINSFTTSDGVHLSYWEAGKGPPLIFVPGWSANGAEYINLLYLLARDHRVIVLDQRNQGLSQKVDYGNRIARFAMDLKELNDHLGIRSANYCGWSMGASVLWSYIDLFGTKGIRKIVFVDEPIAIVAHADWTDQQRLDAGSLAPSPDALIAALRTPPPVHPDPSSRDLMSRFMLRDAPAFANSEGFASAVITNDMRAMTMVLYDHGANDWRDVVRTKINVPAAIFTGEWSQTLPAQRWAHTAIPGSKLFVYTKAEQGDHFLMFKNPTKFAADLSAFLSSR